MGDVSWAVPTVQLSTATWVPGTPAHSWQAVAAGGTSIGMKGMMVAAKTMTLTAIDLFTDPRTSRKRAPSSTSGAAASRTSPASIAPSRRSTTGNPVSSHPLAAQQPEDLLYCI